ncbi:MAG TPA: heme ABC exporter ATP-binding protein CcmA [Caulobacteraceae bacterium]|nr:heme ABC exporter ATP-binding protein CcmA [Caulobacteraceae bacterium]
MIRRLRVEGLALARGDRLLFKDLNLQLAAGQAVALRGRNGAGKTSLLRAIAGFIRPLAGEVAFDGEGGPVEADEARALGVHLTGHHDGLKPGRLAREEFMFQARWCGADAAGMARAAEALDLERLFGLEVRKLSAGQRRRLALGRLAAARRPVWLLDEPFAPLDAEHRARFGDLMNAHLAEGGMILAAVHDPLPIAADSVEIAG